MEYTVFENKETGGRFFSNYTEIDQSEWHNIIGHTNSSEDAKALCNVTRKTNIINYLNSIPDDIITDEFRNDITTLLK